MPTNPEQESNQPNPGQESNQPNQAQQRYFDALPKPAAVNHEYVAWQALATVAESVTNEQGQPLITLDDYRSYFESRGYEVNFKPALDQQFNEVPGQFTLSVRKKA